MSDDSPMSRVARDVDPVRPLNARQRAAWTREVEARFAGSERDELVAMVLGEAS